MEHNLKIVSPDLIMGPLLELLNEVSCVPLVISGNSMAPFLIHHRDTVYLTKAEQPLKRGDMVLYQRDNGSFILHRVFRVEGTSPTYTMVGDAQTQLEPGIRPDQVRAIVTAVRRKDKLLKKNSFWWFFFEKIWIRIVPIRPTIRKVYAILSNLF